MSIYRNKIICLFKIVLCVGLICSLAHASVDIPFRIGGECVFYEKTLSGCSVGCQTVSIPLGIEEDFAFLAQTSPEEVRLYLTVQRGNAERFASMFSFFDNPLNRNFVQRFVEKRKINPELDVQAYLSNEDSYPSLFVYNPKVRRFDVCSSEPFIYRTLVVKSKETPLEIHVIDLAVLLKQNFCGFLGFWSDFMISNQLIGNMLKGKSSVDLLTNILQNPEQCIEEYRHTGCIRDTLCEEYTSLRTIVNCVNSIALLPAGPEFILEIDEIKEILTRLRYIIAMDLKWDQNGLLRLYKQLNPEGVIISVGLEEGTYLSGNDFIVIMRPPEALSIIAEMFASGS